MSRNVMAGSLGLVVVAGLLVWWSEGARAQKGSTAGVHWIWYDEGDPLTDAPAETRYFRRTFEVKTANDKKPIDEAKLDITADNGYTVWINGVEVGKGDNWMIVQTYDVAKHLVAGKNVVAVAARNDGGPAGLLVRLTYIPNGHDRKAVVSDGSWKASKSAGKGWQKVDFDESKWIPAKALGEYNKAGPWKNLAWGKKARTGRFTVPEGFRVELAVQPPDTDSTFSLVNMCFDHKGRLLVSREGGPILLCTDPDKNGVCRTVKPYCDLVKNSQGMCWVNDALLLVGDGPKGTGLYRCRDTKKADRIDEAVLLHKVNGGMGEHGPHAILHGPDGWLYLVVGNHAHAAPGLLGNAGKLADNSPLRRWPNGQQTPDQGKPGSAEDVLLPRQNDANGHAAGLRAPGGTIWRLDHEGKNLSLVAAGFRNEFDAAFSPAGELFTFDSDMEWDEGLPWYRPVRICHCPPGAEFGWRTGSSKIPPYALDTLPAIYDTGRGSPVGLEFYDHFAFPKKYHGCYFMADWSIGVIWGVHLQRDGATYKAKEVEKFCVGAPMNVTDLAVGPDGALYFVMGGRGSQGGVYRIVCTEGGGKKPMAPEKADAKAACRHLVEAAVQPLSAWGREAAGAALKVTRTVDALELMELARDTRAPTAWRLRALTLLHSHFDAAERANIYYDARMRTLYGDKDPEVRAQVVYWLGAFAIKGESDLFLKALKDEDAQVRRRACEALIRAGFAPPVEALWPLLGDKDRFVRTAARLVLQRIDPTKWADPLDKEKSDVIYREGVIALCKEDKAAPYTAKVFARLAATEPADANAWLDHLRTVQLAILHAKPDADMLKPIAVACEKTFPHSDWRVNRELAILLTHFRKEGVITTPIHAKLLDILLKAKDDRLQQIHYFYCLRFLHQGWTTEQKDALLGWYESTKTWTGGASFTRFLENILRDAKEVFAAADVDRFLAEGEKHPLTTLYLLRYVGSASTEKLGALLKRLAGLRAGPRTRELKEVAIAAYAKDPTPAVQAVLRPFAADPEARDAVAHVLSRHPSKENFPALTQCLDSNNKGVVLEVVEALKKSPGKPKADEAAPFRALLLSSGKLDVGQRWKAVELLRLWTNGKAFGADDGDWKAELTSWRRWYAQSFPKEPPLPDTTATVAASKYKYADLLAFLDKDGKKGDATKGRTVFEKAQCLKCHKYGKEGEGIGPDLTNVSKRFKRDYILESIIYPSKVISDQYRSTQFVTKKGVQYLGLAADMGDTITVLQQDGTKVMLKKDEIEQRFASLVSVMPEKLLDALTKDEIADLFAFMESEPAK